MSDSCRKPFPVSTDSGQRLRPVDGGKSDHWAVKRKLFKENKQWSSAGGSSITSDMTDEQGLVQNARANSGLLQKQTEKDTPEKTLTTLLLFMTVL